MQKRSAKWEKTKTLEAKDAPIDALPAQLLFLFIELKVDERERASFLDIPTIRAFR